MRVTRFDAALTYALAALGLWLSYTALADLALRAGLGAHQAAAWPLVVDGLILAATRAVVTFGGHDARRYAWVLLGCAASASIVGNVAHAVLPPGPVHPAIAAVVAVVPPVGALAMTHLAVVRARVRQDVEHSGADSASPQVEAATPVTGDAPTGGDDTVIEAEVTAEPVASVRVVDAPGDELSTPDAPPLAHPADAGDAPVEDVRQQVLDLYAAGGLSGRQIAKTVGVSEATVRRYRDKHKADGDARELRSA
ncbi:DUF2637 domain-containing protein [Rhodococcus erythropolis]|uniref:DUF2637 domain-containing protein n=1 Tax=Rhodococcus erythropolis TaxID=1833 RepID=UPI0008780005|nr:DUF2637 domain-containing protein [Rhodococcus erythropolis]OFV79223.1 hypothetical protein RERY_02290 [Rhodococcus erythropolis]